jgi:hypothetical protein
MRCSTVPPSTSPLVKHEPQSPSTPPVRVKTPPLPSSSSDASLSVEDTLERSVAPSPEPALPVSAPPTPPLALRREPRA